MGRWLDERRCRPIAVIISGLLGRMLPPVLSSLGYNYRVRYGLLALAVRQ